jgi:site-specific DNA recombinase
MYCGLYTRLSEDPTGKRVGVARQLEDCALLADGLEWTVVDHYSDNDISAFDGSVRPEFERMLAAIERGEIGAIICWQPDRLYRSLKDLERLVDATDAGIEIRTVNGGDLDLSHSTGRMLARILGSVARQESELKGERRRRANKQRAINGQWRADMPRIFGYTQHGEPLEPEATAIRQAIHDVLGGRSLRSIATDWNARGLTTPRGMKRGGTRWSNLALRRVLLRPAHAGLVVYQGKVIGRGTWTPLIDEDTHRGLVAFLSDSERRPATTFERKHMGSGVYRCGVCDGKLFSSFRGRAARGMVYVCKPHIHVGRVGEPLDELVSAVVLKLLRGADIESRLAPREGFDMAAMHSQRTALQARLDELARMFAAGEIDASQLRSGTMDLRTQLMGIDQVLADAAATSPAVQLLDGDPNELETRWDASPPDIKGKIVDELMTVTVLPTPRGVKGVTVDRETGERVINPDYVDIKPKV